MRSLSFLLLASLMLASVTTSAADPIAVGGLGPPVLLVTGPEADEGLYRWSEGGGLADTLVRHGFSVWIGAGDDLAGDIVVVKEAAGATQVSLVGHGLGGTACFRYLANDGDLLSISALVTLGAPYGWQDPSPLQAGVTEALANPVAPRYSRLLFRPSPLPAAGEDLFTAAFTNLPDDRAAALVKRAREAGATTRHGALDDLPEWIDGAGPLTPVEIPALIACGECDRFAPCEDAWRARDALGASATFHKFGYMNLDGIDFGHLDLMLTDEARRRIFPEVVRFLKHGRVR